MHLVEPSLQVLVLARAARQVELHQLLLPPDHVQQIANFFVPDSQVFVGFAEPAQLFLQSLHLIEVVVDGRRIALKRTLLELGVVLLHLFVLFCDSVFFPACLVGLLLEFAELVSN